MSSVTSVSGTEKGANRWVVEAQDMLGVAMDCSADAGEFEVTLLGESVSHDLCVPWQKCSY